MQLKKIKTTVAAGALLVMAGTGSVFGQADALVDMLQKKGLLTQREANDVKEQMFSDIREQMPGAKLKVGSWLDEMRLYGDMRLRYEKFWDRDAPSTTAGVAAAAGTTSELIDRTRFRYRLRAGMTAIAGDWEAGLRLASGDSDDATADSVSTNTSFDSYGSKKPINIDMAYLTYKPSRIDGLVLTGGKMENTFWETDMVYDGDLTPEGFSEQYTRKFGDNYSLFATLGQWVLDENSTGVVSGAEAIGEDAYMFGYQLGHSWKIMPKKVELKQAVAFYDYVGLDNTAVAPFTGAVTRNSTSVVAGGTVLAKQFKVFAMNQELSLGFFKKLPIHIQGEWIKNTATQIDDQGYKVGVVFGKAKKKGEWEVGYWYEELEPDATLSWFADSDFGQGGTNGKGHILKAKYNLTDWMQLGLAYWHVEAVDNTVEVGTGPVGLGNAARTDNRLQADIVMKF